MEKTEYNYNIVRSFVNWNIIRGQVAVLVGVIVSFQMVDPRLNFPPHLTFGRMRRSTPMLESMAGGWALFSPHSYT